MEGWNDFFMAIAGAAAALTGLIFVGVSISLQRILSVPQLPSRASQSLTLLLTVLIVTSLCLVPRQPFSVIAIEILCIGIIVWIIALRSDLDTFRKTNAEYKKYVYQNILLTQLAVLPYIISGIIMLFQGFSGMYWIIPSIIFSFIKAVLDAWVLLVEIHR